MGDRRFSWPIEQFSCLPLSFVRKLHATNGPSSSSYPYRAQVRWHWRVRRSKYASTEKTSVCNFCTVLLQHKSSILCRFFQSLRMSAWWLRPIRVKLKKSPSHCAGLLERKWPEWRQGGRRQRRNGLGLRGGRSDTVRPTIWYLMMKRLIFI